MGLSKDLPILIKYHTRTSSSIPPHHRRTYQLAATVTVPLIISILLFWIITHGQPALVLAWDILPQSFLFLLAVFFLLPFQRLSRTGRYRFLSTLKRVSIGGIAEADNGKFGDILLADVLTSYAKVLGDLFVSWCMLLSPGLSSTGKPDRNCGGAYMVPLIISVPSMIRLRQCLIEFLRVRNNPNKNATTGWGGYAEALSWSQYEERADEIMQTTPRKCSEVFQRFPSHRSERAAARDESERFWHDRSEFISFVVGHSF